MLQISYRMRNTIFRSGRRLRPALCVTRTFYVYPSRALREGTVRAKMKGKKYYCLEEHSSESL